MKPKLNAGLWRFPHTESIIDEPVVFSDGTVLNARQTQRVLKPEESGGIDIWDLPLVRYIQRKEIDLKATAIPVWTTRRFVQWMFEVPENSDIHDVKDLEGKRIVQHYHANTDTIWTKGLLEETYGVDFSGVSWFSTVAERVQEHPAPPETILLEGAKRDDLLFDGIVDAAMTSGHGNPLRPGLRGIYANPEAEAAKWYEQWPIFPMLHVVLVKDAVLSAHESLAYDLFRVFQKAKIDALAKWDHGKALPDDRKAAAFWSGFPGSDLAGERSFLGEDPLPYGFDIENNRETVERMIRYAYNQRAIYRPYEIEELFVAVDS